MSDVGAAPVADNEASEVDRVVRAAAITAGAIIVRASINGNASDQIPEAVLTLDEAQEVIGAVRPAIIYLTMQNFESADELGDARERLATLGVTSDPPALRAALTKIKQREGQMCRALARFVVGPVLHSVYGSAAWYDDFETAIEDVISQAGESAGQERRIVDSATAARVEAMAMELSNHPSFNHGRVSFEKRLVLAEAVFPDDDSDARFDATRRAEALFWLAQSGFERPKA